MRCFKGDSVSAFFFFGLLKSQVKSLVAITVVSSGAKSLLEAKGGSEDTRGGDEESFDRSKSLRRSETLAGRRCWLRLLVGTDVLRAFWGVTGAGLMVSSLGSVELASKERRRSDTLAFFLAEWPRGVAGCGAVTSPFESELSGNDAMQLLNQFGDGGFSGFPCLIDREAEVEGVTRKTWGSRSDLGLELAPGRI